MNKIALWNKIYRAPDHENEIICEVIWVYDVKNCKRLYETSASLYKTDLDQN